MSFNEKTGLPDLDADYHIENDIIDEEAEPDDNDQKKEPHFELQEVKASTFSNEEYEKFEQSDDDFEEEFNKGTEKHQNKHWVKIEIDDSKPSKRSKYVAGVIEALKREWPNPEFFDNTDGGLRYSFVVSQI